ncbi:MAG: hypothetical protein Unbinned6284contig1001_29 [Prokaryotic dsDNA virus sp.]|nr:MAG: hypothetical protein Unbinned6284contig1001_29 [Prokaryotic dsDNA virus sp.]|tara:strand:- start:2378 stop:2617 length:240 start_codon:yes stop_codon:yes gene_type:complete
MKLEGNEQSQRFDLILALLQKKGELTYHDKIALDENIKKLEMFLFNHESDTENLKDTIKNQESVINTYLGKGSKYSIKG